MQCLKVLHQLSLTSCVYTDRELELSYVDVNVVAFLQFMLMHTSPFAVQVEPTIFLEMSPIYHFSHECSTTDNLMKVNKVNTDGDTIFLGYDAASTGIWIPVL
jgi:hypothetical protein